MKVVSLENLSKYNELLNQKTVRSVNSVKPDSNGNVQLGTEKSTFNKVEFDTGYFSISTAKAYNFDLTGTDLENVSKENVNIRLVAKVTTAHDGYEVGDIAQLSPGVDHMGSNVMDICSYISGNTLYVYSGANQMLSIANGAGNWLQKANVQIKAILTAFVPNDGSILLIAEDQTNTSKLIGLPDGTLTWKDKNLVRSVNGVNADSNGNVTISASCIPNYSAKIDITATNLTYTAPTKGILYVGTYSGTYASVTVKINGILFAATGWGTTEVAYRGSFKFITSFILDKGDVATWSFTGSSSSSTFNFFPFR